jgi:hypothetical protein
MADEITTDTQTEAIETPVSSSPVVSIDKQTETTDSTDSVVSVLPDEIPIEPANSPLENPIEKNSEIQSENIEIEPIPEIIEQKQENIQNTEIEKTESTIQAEVKIPDVPIQGENDKTETKEPDIKKEEEKRETIKNETSTPVFVPTPSVVLSSFEINMKRARELLVKARATIQFRKRKKLDKIMTLFLKKREIKNDDVEKLLHVSDATATVYLSILKKENKIKSSGKKGINYSYIKT